MLPKAWMIMVTVCLNLIQILTGTDSPSESDEIIRLPNQPKVSFRQFAGYIAVDENNERALFYYFVEAETDSNLKPLVLWLTGGPGCSSVGAGAFIEHGPFKPRGESLLWNEYSWNKEANMLYLESPAGVGFSYSSDKSFYAYVNDEITARDNLIFLERWFIKFPEYQNRDFYITGESYGGHYVPQLAQLITQSDIKFNMKGIAIGNPLLDFNTDFNSRGEYLWSHGLISDSTYEALNSFCNYSQIIRRQYQNVSVSPVCSVVSNQLEKEVGTIINSQDVTLDVCLSSIRSQFRVLTQMQETKEIDVCIGDETNKYLNREDVQKSFHARLIGVNSWTICSGVLHYDMQNLEIPTINTVGSLVKSGIRVLIYSGDQDSVIPLIGTRTLVSGLAKELGLNTTVSYRAWLQGQQVGGWTQVYGDILTFATIRGGSHPAPFSQPDRSLGLFSAFLKGQPLPEAR